MRERIKAVRKMLGLTQQEFAEAIGVKQNTIAQYELGRNRPTDMAVNLICREFGVDEGWLRNGEGEMFRARSRDEELSAFTERLINAGDDDFRARFVLALSRMGPRGWEALEQFIDDIAQSK